MVKTDVIIVGGGPAGSTCARYLLKNGVDCIILDRQQFPRPKLCAGWITPQVLDDLQFSINEYPHGIKTFPFLKVQVKGFRFKYHSKQHSIRRLEFDNWLLKRSNANYKQHHVKSIIKKDGNYEIDNKFAAKFLIGAGGTNCPVYHTFFKNINSRKKEDLIITLEEEFKYRYNDNNCYLWFLDNNLPGYSWYVPKENGFLNIGIGGYKIKLKQNNDNIKNQWLFFTNKLADLSLVSNYQFSPKGYYYYIRSNVKNIQIDNTFIIGDAAGLATIDMGEGIGPAVQSGLLAADAIIHDKELSFETISKYSIKSKIIKKIIEYRINILN